MQSKSMDFTHFKVDNCPPSVFYIPSFLSKTEEEAILTHVDGAPKPKWTQLLNRRLINYGGVPHKNGMISEALPGWLSAQVDAVNSLGVFDKVKANHVLVNEYLPGQGIMPHDDGPLFHPVICTISCGSHTVLRFHENDTQISDTDANTDSYSDADTATAHAAKVPENRKLICQLLIEPRSLLILKHDMYTKYLHSIAEQTHDTITTQLANLGQCADDELKNQLGGTIERNRRISLTIRHVPKTSKLRLRLGH